MRILSRWIYLLIWSVLLFTAIFFSGHFFVQLLTVDCQESSIFRFELITQQ